MKYHIRIYVLEVVTLAVHFQRTVIAEYIFFFRKTQSDNLEELTVCIWEANIKINVNGIGKATVGWIHLAQDMHRTFYSVRLCFASFLF
jgi:hypothetical protein